VGKRLKELDGFPRTTFSFPRRTPPPYPTTIHPYFQVASGAWVSTRSGTRR